MTSKDINRNTHWLYNDNAKRKPLFLCSRNSDKIGSPLSYYRPRVIEDQTKTYRLQPVQRWTKERRPILPPESSSRLAAAMKAGRVATLLPTASGGSPPLLAPGAFSPINYQYSTTARESRQTTASARCHKLYERRSVGGLAIGHQGSGQTNAETSLTRCQTQSWQSPRTSGCCSLSRHTTANHQLCNLLFRF